MHQMTCAVTSQANIVVNGISIEKSTASCCASVFLHPTNALLGKKFSPVWANSYQLQSSQSRTMIQPTPYLTHQKRHLHGWPTNYSCLPFFNVANIHQDKNETLAVFTRDASAVFAANKIKSQIIMQRTGCSSLNSYLKKQGVCAALVTTAGRRLPKSFHYVELRSLAQVLEDQALLTFKKCSEQRSAAVLKCCLPGNFSPKNRLGRPACKTFAKVSCWCSLAVFLDSIILSRWGSATLLPPLSLL